MAILFLAPVAWAQSPGDYSVLIDADNDSTTGCSLAVPGTGQTLDGKEFQLTASVDAALQVADVALQACQGGSFEPAQSLGGGYPAGLNNGLAGADVIEIGIDLLDLGLPGATRIGLAFSAENGGDGDVMSQAPGGGPVVFGIEGLPVLPVSTLGIGGLLLLASMLLVAGIYAARHSRLMALSILGVLLMPLAWAAGFMLDGQTGDWAGETQVAADADGDASNGSSRLDLTAAFAGEEAGRLYFRIDVADLENDAPTLTFPTSGVNFEPGAGAVNIGPVAALADVDSDAFNGVTATLDIAGTCDALDTITIEDQGSGAGQIGFDGTTVSYEGAPISTSVQPWVCLTPGDGTQDALVIELDSASADQAAAQALVRALQFDSTSGDDSPREAEVVIADDADATGSALQTINVDEAPQISSPVDGNTNVDPVGDLTVNFSEPVDIASGALALECGAAVGFSTTPGLPATGVGSIDLTPTSSLTPNAACTLTVFAASVSDSDAIDPPDNPAADAVFDFTVEAPPEIVATSPVDSAADIAADVEITIEFSEPVNAAAGAFTLECPATIGLGAAANGSQDIYTLTPASNLPAGASCQLTIAAGAISDVDATDPPDNLDGNGDGTTGDDYTFGFTVDQAPTLQSVEVEVGNAFTTVPGAFGGAGGINGVDDDTGIRTTFSEPVNDNGGTTVTCTSSGTIASGGSGLTVAGNGSNQLTLTRTSGTFTVGETCAVSFNEPNLTDVDASDPPDALETPAPAVYEFEVAPEAQADGFTVTSHLEARFDTVAPGTSNLLSNDQAPGASIAEINGSPANAGTQIALASGAYLTVESDGDFNYVPPPDAGSGATDSFTYTLNAPNGSLATATVTMTIEGTPIWYVDGDATGPIYNGTAAFPFAALGGSIGAFDPFTAGDDATVFVYDSASDNSSIECGLNVLPGQQVIGEGEPAGSIDVLTGRAPVPETVVAPDTTGAAPELFATSSCFILTANNEFRGLDIGDTTGSVAFSNSGGASVGNLLISNVGVRGTGGILSLPNGGTLLADFNETFSTGSIGPAIQLVGVSGSLDSAFGSITNTGDGDPAILISGGNLSGTLSVSVSKTNSGPLLAVTNGHTGSLTLTDIMSASAGEGLQFTNADGTYTLSSLVSIGGGTAGINVSVNSDGDLNITNAASFIQGIQGIPFRVNDSAMNIDYDGEITHRASTGSLVSARAIEIINSNGTISLDGTVAVGDASARATAEAVYLQNTGNANTIAFDYLDGTMNNTTMFRSLVSGSVAVDRLRVNCDGDLTVGGDTHCVDISDTTSSGFTIEAMTTDLDDAGDNGGALSLVNTPGTWTVEDVSGGLTGSLEPMIFGLNFGTLNLATFNSPSSPGGIAGGALIGAIQPALDLENGTMNLSIDDLRVFNPVGNGIRVVDVDGPGLEVLDGQIPSAQDDAVVLENTGNVTLNSMEITNGAANGVFGQNVTNFTLTDSLIRDNGDAVDEGGLRFVPNLLGSATISNTTIDGSAEHNIEIRNESGSLVPLTITGSTIDRTSPTLGGDGLLLEVLNSAVVDVQVSNTTFLDNRSDAIEIAAQDNSSAGLTIDGSTFNSNLDASPAGSVAARALTLAAGSDASLDFDIGSQSINLFTNFSPGNSEAAINLNLLSTSLPTAQVTGRIRNNIFDNSGGAVGIDGNGNGTMVLGIEDNTAMTSLQSIEILTGDSAAMDLTLFGNSLTSSGIAAAPLSEAIAFGAFGDTETCFNIRANTASSSSPGSVPEIFLNDVTTTGGTVSLESGLSGDCGGSCAGAEAHLLSANVLTTASASGSVVLTPPGSCATVP